MTGPSSDGRLGSRRPRRRARAALGLFTACGLGAILGAILGAVLGAGCALAPRTSGSAPGPIGSEAWADDAPPSSIAEWEARQLRHADALRALAGIRPDGAAAERLRRVQESQAGSGGRAPSKPADPGWREPRPTTPVSPSTPERGPEPVSPAEVPRPVAAPPPPAADRFSRRYRAEAKLEVSLRCRQVCRHVRAICQAAGRICRIAGTLGDAPAREACRRGEARCTEARGIAGRLCPSCPHEETRTRSSAWRKWSALLP